MWIISGLSLALTLKWSLRTRMMSSKVAPALKGVWGRTSSRPQRPPSSVLHTMQGERLKRGLKWKATSALGWTLLPQDKSTWNLEETQKTSQQVQRLRPPTCSSRGLGLGTESRTGTGTTNLSASAGTEPWMSTISPGARPPKMVPLKGRDCAGQTDRQTDRR